MTSSSSQSSPVDAVRNPPSLIINAALTGVIPGKSDTPHVPVTVDEIVADGVGCLDAGASIIHVHARDGRGNPTSDPAIYAEIFSRIRSQRPDAILCATTTGRGGADADQRAAVLNLIGDEKPDMASLTLGSVDFPDASCVNTAAFVRDLALKMVARSIRPELEIFHSGMLNSLRMLMAKGIIKTPAYCNFILGSAHMAQATLADMAHLVAGLPDGVHWAAGGVGRFQSSVTETALAMGGHVRIGLEDNIWLDRGRTRLATNVELVKRVARMAGEVNRKLATPAQAREMLGL
ncbi:3-keto-5-aminohexanoate cleavage protein [Pseudodesulfovibrio sp.]|nr:3-keto-5-aminohexanoate cleavage protein [Pseudodesulfovibrio sp.]